MTVVEQSPLVVGGGMAGLMLSATLGQMGCRSTVLERASSLDEVGAGVQLSPRSVQLLRRIGVLNEVLEQAVAIAHREVRSWDGEIISRTELGEHCEERYGAPYLAVHRADLQRALVGAVPNGAINLRSRAERISSDSQGARVTLADGRIHEGSVVVGVDGIRSTVRANLAPDRPVASGLAAYRAMIPAALAPAGAVTPVVRIWVGPGAHAVVYPIRGGEMLNIVAVVPSAEGSETWTHASPVSELLSAYVGWDDLLTRVIAAVGTTSAWALHDREPLQRLGSGRVVLAGDAAHPMLPFAAQGVNQALEDAWVLGGCLAAPGPSSVAARINTYSRLRYPQAAQAQMSSRHLAASLHVPDGPWRDERDAQLVAGASLTAQDALLAPLGWLPPS